MGLWSQKQLEQINATAVKVEKIETVKAVRSDSITRELEEMSRAVLEYFKDSPAILLTTETELHDYVTKMIEAGIGGIDTETTGLDRIQDHIVGASLYYPGGVECYIPNKHILPIFNSPYANQLSYEVVAREFQRFNEAKTKMIYANADFDLAMLWHSYGVDMNPSFYYDVQLAWRCIKEDEKDNALKVLYNKYVLKGKGDPKKFSDFFTPSHFPYAKPEVAKLYAANDAKITYELYMWQLPWITKGHPKCKKAGLEKIADLVWNLEMPLVPAIQNLHRRGAFIDQEVASKLVKKYDGIYQAEMVKLRKLVQEVLDNPKYAPPIGAKRPFLTANEFNPGSTLHVSYLLYTCMKQEGKGTDKSILGAMHIPVADQILEVRHLLVLINTFVQKLPKLAKNSGNMIHGTFKQIGADTGRMSSAEPNLQNIPSHVTDIRHMFRARPGYATEYEVSDSPDDSFVDVKPGDSVRTPKGYRPAKELKVGDSLIFITDSKLEEEVHVKEISSGEDGRIRLTVI
jgi:DNA polymerase-1